MVVRTVDQRDVEAMIDGVERECRDLADRLDRAQARLRNLQAVRDFVKLGPEGFGLSATDRPMRMTRSKPLASGHTHVSLPSADSSVADLIDFVLRDQSLRMKEEGKNPGMKPADISKAIWATFGRKVDSKKINGRLWYLKSRNAIGWSEGFYHPLLDYSGNVEEMAESDAA